MVFIGCEFTGNVCAFRALTFPSDEPLRVSFADCRFEDNGPAATSVIDAPIACCIDPGLSGFPGPPGPLEMPPFEIHLTNCLLEGNHASGDKPRLIDSEASLTITNCTIVNNAGGIAAPMTVTNSIVWNSGESGMALVNHYEHRGRDDGVVLLTSSGRTSSRARGTSMPTRSSPTPPTGISC